MVLTAELAQLLALGTGSTPVAALTALALRLADPVHDRLRMRLDLAGKVLRSSS